MLWWTLAALAASPIEAGSADQRQPVTEDSIPVERLVQPRDRLSEKDILFLKLNRRTGLGLAIRLGGATTVAGGLALAMLTPSPGVRITGWQVAGAGLVLAGATTTISGHAISLIGAHGAARRVQSYGVDVSRSWSYLGTASSAALLCAPLVPLFFPAVGRAIPRSDATKLAFGAPALAILSLSILSPIAQSRVNRAGFRAATGARPRRASLQLTPIHSKRSSGLALSGVW